MRPAGESRPGRGEHGSAAVEFALVLPLVLILCLALLQVGLLVKDQVVVSEAARAGGREGAVTTDDEAVRQAALEAAASLDSARMQVDVQRDGGAGGAVTVTVTYAAPIAIPLVSWLFPEAVELRGVASFRQEV